MKTIFKFISIAVVLFLSCSSYKREIETYNNEKVFTKNKYWINTEYFNCIENQLPGDCIGQKPYALAFDSLEGVEVYQGIEPYYADIIKKEEKYFLELSDTITELIFDKKKKILSVNNMKFISKDHWNHLVKSNFLDRVNGDRFQEKYGKIVRKYFKKDSFFITYNTYRNFHLLGDGMDCSKTRLIEYSKNTINIFDYKNGCDPKNIQRKVEKELLISFQK